MNIVLYTTGCPQCKVLKTKLDSKNIQYDIVDDITIMMDKGFLSAPNLEIDDKAYDFNKARKLVDAYDGTQSFEDYYKSLME